LSYAPSVSKSRLAPPRPAALVLGLVLAACSLLVSPASAQFRPPTDTLYVGGEIGGPRSLPEQGYMQPFLNLNRAFLGTRAMGMGGTGMALDGGPSSVALNPASLAGLRNWTLTSEYRFVSGSGSVTSFPARLDVGADQPLEATGYRVSPRLLSTYYQLSMGLPLVFLGRPGALGLSYHRFSPAFQGEETRFELVGPITNNTPATTGVGQNPGGGLDAVTVTLASEASKWLNLGANLNFQSGTISNSVDIGAAVFGQQVTGGGLTYQQDVNGFNIGLGADVDLGKFQFGGSVFLGYDLKFEFGRAVTYPLPDIQEGPSGAVFRVNENLLDHQLSIPTALAGGIAYNLKDNFVVTADLWYLPWSKSTITRQNISDVNMFFIDPEDSSTFKYQLQFGEGTETFNARLHDNNSIRFGAEYVFQADRPVRFPVRMGFRKETLPINNITVPPQYADYQELVDNYWRYVCGQPGCPQRDPAEAGEDTQAIIDNLKEVLEHNNLVFQGKGIDATTFSLGVDMEFGNLAFQFAAQRTSYDIERFFFQAFNPDLSPFAATTQEGRKLTSMSFAATYKF